MSKQKKNKIDVIFERSATEYADRVVAAAKQSADFELSKKGEKYFHTLIKNSYIAGECHMYTMLMANITEKN